MKARVLLLALTSTLTPSSSSAEATAPQIRNLYTIALPEFLELQSLHKKLQVYYSCDGRFPQSFDSKRIGNKREITITTGHARTLEVVIYNPGFETITVYEPSLVTSNRRTELPHINRVDPITFNGKIDSFRPIPKDDAEVEVTYSGHLGFSHANFGAGGLITFKLGSGVLDPDGAFWGECKNFFEDPLSQATDKDSRSISLAVRSKKTGNVLRKLSARFKGKGSSLSIPSSYDCVVSFNGPPGE